MNRFLKLTLLLLALCILPLAASAQNDRGADRAAIKAHIESIFQAFINKDNAALRATHAENWLGYLGEGRQMIKGIDDYMQWNEQDPKQPYGMKSYKLREFDMIFKGDAAFVCFVANVDSNTPNGPFQRALRICDFVSLTASTQCSNANDGIEKASMPAWNSVARKPTSSPTTPNCSRFSRMLFSSSRFRSHAVHWRGVLPPFR